MTKATAIAGALAACFLIGVGHASYAQASTTAAPPSSTTGSGKDTGINVPSGMSGSGPAGVGTVGAPAAPGSGKTNKHKKSSNRRKSSRPSARMTPPVASAH